MRLIKLIPLVCVLAADASAQIMVYETGTWLDIQVAAQADDGTILAAGSGTSWRAWRWNQNWQPSYNDSPWNAWGSSDTANAIPSQMNAMGNGLIASLWEHKDADTAVLLVHNDGMNHPKMRSILGPAALARFGMDSLTNFWVTEAGLNISKAPAPINRLYQKPLLVHTITVDELWPGGDVTNRLPVSMIEDGRGRMWFWSSCLFGGDNRGAVRGVLIADGDTVTHHPVIISNLNNRISVIAPMGATDVWVAVRDAGIFSVNIETHTAMPVAEPETNAFRVVHTVFTVGDDRYVISGDPYQYDKRGLLNSLWRCRDGQWTKLIDGMDSGARPEQLADRRWRITRHGLWLGAFGMGGWFIPNDGSAPRQINWQAGSPLDNVDRWFELKDGRMVAIQFGRGGLVADAALLAASPGVPPTSQIIRTSRPLLHTGEGKVFAILRGDESALNEWTGTNWKRHTLPDNLLLWGDCRIASDAKGRVWLVDWNYNPDPALRPCLILDPRNGQFQRYSTFRAALQTQATTLAGTQLRGLDSFAVTFSTDGRVAYEDRTWNVCFFDGREWRQFHINQIVGGGIRDQANRDPFFSADGKLSMVLNGTLRQFDDPGGWRDTEIPGSSVRGTTPGNAETNARSTPNVPDAESIVADSRGIYWVVARKQLFRVGYGLRAPCFPANEPQPFADGRKLTGVLTDNWGGAFLRTVLQGREEYVYVPGRHPLSAANARVRNENDGSVVLDFSAPGVASPRFAWRVDDADWSDAVTNTTLRLDDLTRGSYRVQVVTVDERLQVSPTPFDVSVRVETDPTQRVQQWILQLADKTYSRREAAVQSLARHRETSLPLLRKALETANADQRWWIEAAIRECE
ncbi:MAG TPA: hypothetical protein PKA41_08900 [Verrucomicrobiota bacterium]|nr:hypothetical protein [Verrucomicrobiota bacterium]